MVEQLEIVTGGYEDVTIVGLLITAIIIIWKAFNKKDASESKMQQQNIDLLTSIIERMEKKDEERQNHIKRLQDTVDDLKKDIDNLNTQ